MLIGRRLYPSAEMQSVYSTALADWLNNYFYVQTNEI